MKALFFITFLFLSVTAFSQEVPGQVTIAGIPQPLSWVIEPTGFSQTEDGIEITAGANTNMFYAPHGNFNVSNMPKLLFQPSDNFVLSAKAKAKQKSRWEAAMLVVYIDESYWAKFCFENESPGVNRMVTVVTNEVSDDAYSGYVDGDSVYMRVTKKGMQIEFAYSSDGEKWDDVRYFRLNSDKPIKVGFSSQSPIGDGLSSFFSEIKYEQL